MPDWPMIPGHSDGLVVEPGRAVQWHEPGWPTFVEGIPHSYATLEITAAPTRSDLVADAGEGSVLRLMHGVSTGMLANAALMAGCAALELRYVAEPVPDGPATIRMFVTAMCHEWTAAPAQAAATTACATLPSGFTWSTPRDPLRLAGNAPEDPGRIVIELRREEEVTFPQWDHVPAEFYYGLRDVVGDGSGWDGFWRVLSHTHEAVEVSLLFQQSDVHYGERDVLGGVLSDLALLSEPRTDYDLYGNPYFVPPCMNARMARESWEALSARLRRPLLARLAVRSEPTSAVTVASALASAVAQGSKDSHPMHYEAARAPIDVRQASHSFNWLEILPWGGHKVWSDQSAPHTLRRFAYLFGLEQAAALMVLPLPDDQGVTGMPRSRTMATRRQSTGPRNRVDGSAAVRLGRNVHLGESTSDVDLPLDALLRHALVVGSSGYGKTTTVQSLLTQLWRDHQVPFLVVEPFPRSEYRSLIRVPGMHGLQVITIGDDSIAPLRFNPMEPPPGVRCELHQQSVLATLKTALPLFSPQDTILIQAIPLAYELAGWDEDSTIEDGLAPPTLRTLMAAYEQVFAGVHYTGDALNIGRGFQTRMEGLLSGAKGRVLDTVRSHDMTALLARPTVIELKNVVDAEEGAVFTSFLVDRIRQEAVRRGSSGNRLRHVTVIEEAQQILGAGASSRNTQGVSDPRAAAVQNFANAVSTLRAYGEGIVMSTQRPVELHPQAIANTATRVVLHLEEAEDRAAVMRSFDAEPELERIASRLQQGEAVARWPGLDEAEVVRIEPEPDVDTSATVPDDEVSSHMAAHRDAAALILPYSLCTLRVCVSGCDARRRRAGRRLAVQLAETATKATKAAVSARQPPVTAVGELVADHAPTDLPLAYCAATHLSVSGLLPVPPLIDGSAELEASIVARMDQR